MAVEITPLGFQKPDGNELVKQGDNVIAANAQKSEDRHQEDRSRLGLIEAKNTAQDTDIAAVGTNATAYTDAQILGTTKVPIQLLGTEDLNSLVIGAYRVASSATATSLGLPSAGHGFLLVQRNTTSAIETWTDVSPTDPSTWTRSLSGGTWSAWLRTDGLKAAADAKAYTDAAKAAAVDAAIGPKVIALDTDGTPYYSPTLGTLRIFPDTDGIPYYALDPWPTTAVDVDGTPYLTY